MDMDSRLPTRAANSSKTVLLELFNFIRTVDQTMLKFSSKINERALLSLSLVIPEIR